MCSFCPLDNVDTHAWPILLTQTCHTPLNANHCQSQSKLTVTHSCCCRLNKVEVAHHCIIWVKKSFTVVTWARLESLTTATMLPRKHKSACSRPCRRRTRPLEQMPAPLSPSWPYLLTRASASKIITEQPTGAEARQAVIAPVIEANPESPSYPFAGAKASTVVATGAEGWTTAVVVNTVGLKRRRSSHVVIYRHCRYCRGRVCCHRTHCYSRLPVVCYLLHTESVRIVEVQPLLSPIGWLEGRLRKAVEGC